MTCDSKTFTISDPTRTGYTFDGWTVVGDGITQTDNGTSTTLTKNQAGNMTITANWTPIPYKQIVKSTLPKCRWHMGNLFRCNKCKL